MSLALSGIGVSRGIAIGKAYLLQRGLPEVSEYAIPKAQIKDEVTRFMQAVDGGAAAAQGDPQSDPGRHHRRTSPPSSTPTC